MNLTSTELLLYVIFILSIGSYAAAFSVRWPAQCFHSWNKEAHSLLSIPFIDTDKDSLKTTRSHCNHCLHSLAWRDLIPVFSYLRLKGKCRYCNFSISYRYPAIELLHLLLCLPLIWRSSEIYSLILQAILISTLITAAVIDLEHKLIPDECCVVTLMCALLLHLLNRTLEHSIIGMIVGYCFIYILYQAYFILRKQEGIGLGDIKLITALSAWLGIYNLALLLLCASLTGILYTVAFHKNDSTKIAFGPFLIFSGIIVFYL